MRGALDAALERGDAAGAWAAAHALGPGRVDLDYALAIVVLVSVEDPDRYDAAAARWIDRWHNETAGAAGRTRERLQRALADLPSLEAISELTPLAAAFGWDRATRALEHLYPTPT